MDALRDLIEARMSRRNLLGGLAGTASVIALLGGLSGCKPDEVETSEGAPSGEPRGLAFTDLAQQIADGDAVADGYEVQRLISWGDPILSGAPAFDPASPSAAAQAGQFGYNNDFLAFFPLPAGSSSSDHGLLVANHEYTNPELIFAGFAPKLRTPEQTAFEIAAHGLSVIEIRKEGGRWSVVPESRYNRRVTAATPIAIAGPAAGHERMKTSADPQGMTVRGTLNNCSGGTTPWGTALSAEENVHSYFGGTDPMDLPHYASYAAMGLTKAGERAWHRDEPRFDLGKEPNEPNRFGWVVEIDPYDPAAQPVKRTALGRFKHEAATTAIAADGRLVVYMGDDEPFQFLYRFVSSDKIDPANNAANASLLDRGTLSAARFSADGRLTWLPLIHGQGPLTAENGFASEADILIDTRRAARLLDATPMDRPEDVEVSPANGRVYAVLTNNRQRAAALTPGNPRDTNHHGHILELTAPAAADGKPDHGAEQFSWDAFILAGKVEDGASYGEGTAVWLSAPDNLAFDPHGRLWIASDQGKEQAGNGIPDGIFACETDGAARARLKFFYAVPRGAECCGPAFTPDGATLFVAIQHPAEGSTFEEPSTRWPDFKDAVPPRPSVVAIVKKDGGVIGG